jgi:hypothetical protein
VCSFDLSRIFQLFHRQRDKKEMCFIISFLFLFIILPFATKNFLGAGYNEECSSGFDGIKWEKAGEDFLPTA